MSTSKKARRDAELSKSFKRVFEGEDGQYVLHHLMTSFNMFTSCFDPDPCISAFNQGRRDAISYILTALETDPTQIIKSARRQREREKQHDDLDY